MLEKGVISKSDKVPYIVNPLTVAYNRNGKPWLVLDCRHINKFLHLFKVKFEDIKVAEYIFEENSFLFTYDLKEQELSKAHIPPAVAIRGCNTFREKTKLSKIS